jgi:predicted dehydrogenase
VYEDYRELLAKEKPELVTIATPDFLHADPFIRTVEAGAKGIFVEKPLATSMDDATRMVEAARKTGVVVNVDFTRRWMPQYVAARVQVDKGRIGKLSQIIIEIGGERAMLWRNHPHAIDLLAYYAGADPEWVVGELEPGYEGYGTEYKGDGGKTTSTEPAANYYVAFRNGVRATARSPSRRAGPCSRSKGSVETSDFPCAGPRRSRGDRRRRSNRSRESS